MFSPKIDLSDKEVVGRLIESCVRGNQKSQKLLYQEFYGKMLTVCVRYADNREEAKDILHDAYIKVFSNLINFENKGSLEGWIRRIVVNTAIDYVRKKREIYSDYLIENNADEDKMMPLDELEETKYKELKAEIILKLMQKLSPAYRAVFNLFVIENYSHNEIAAELNINVGTSKSNLAKAKMKLKELFDKYLEEKD